MLASIGVIIAKQIYEVFGVAPTKGADPLALIGELPQKLPAFNPEIAAIGVAGLLILFGLPWIPRRR